MTRSSLSVEEVLGEDGILSRLLPSYEFRPQQLAMAQGIERSLRQGGVLLVEAGTGVGKTLAYLIPAILSGKRVVVSTGTKTLQEQIANKEIPLLRRLLPDPFRVSFLKGRNNYLCLYRYDHLEPSLLSVNENQGVIEEIRSWVSRTPYGDRAELEGLSDQSALWKELSVTGEQCLGSRCERFSDCFITRLRQEAMKADLVVVNHHLFFADLALRRETFGEILPPYEAVIFDEAHLLEEVAGHYFGLSFSSYRLEELERDIRRELGISGIKPERLGYGLKHLGERSEAFFDQFRIQTQGLLKGGNGHEESERERLRWIPKGMSSSLREAGHGLRSLLETLEGELSILADQSEGIRSLADRTRSGQRELSFLLEEGTQGYVSWYEIRGHGVFLQTTPLDVSGHLRERFFNKGLPIILTSATLSVEGSFDYLKRGLGLKNTDVLLLDSPFDFKRQLLLYLPSQMAHPRSEHFVEWASEEILRILRRSHGRAFVLTTSHRHMEELYKRCKERTDLPLLKQGNKPRHRLLQEFQGVVSSVLFATASFWQGVDVQGDSLSCVIIVKLPFASPTDPITAGKIEYLREQGEDPFQVYQLPKAVIQLKQGVGRLIRTARDRGVIALLDRRLLEQSYGARFLKSLPPAPLTQDEAEIERFLRVVS